MIEKNTVLDGLRRNGIAVPSQPTGLHSRSPVKGYEPAAPDMLTAQATIHGVSTLSAAQEISTVPAAQMTTTRSKANAIGAGPYRSQSAAEEQALAKSLVDEFQRKSIADRESNLTEGAVAQLAAAALVLGTVTSIAAAAIASAPLLLAVGPVGVVAGVAALRLRNRARKRRDERIGQTINAIYDSVLGGGIKDKTAQDIIGAAMRKYGGRLSQELQHPDKAAKVLASGMVTSKILAKELTLVMYQGHFEDRQERAKLVDNSGALSQLPDHTKLHVLLNLPPGMLAGRDVSGMLHRQLAAESEVPLIPFVPPVPLLGSV